MYKYVYEILQELSIQRPSSRQKSSRCYSTHDQNETAKTSLSPKHKQLKNYVLTKLNKIHAEKQILLAKKRKALLWYKMILDKMVSPLIEYMPNVTTSYHLSKIADFRTNEGFSERSIETNKKRIIVRPKCVEEPLPILIKPEYKVLKCRKKGWKIMNKLTKARDSKNEMINKYKIWKNKVEKDPEGHKKFGKKQGLLVYDLFLKDAIESKIEDLMPSIKAKNDQSNVYDFRFQSEPELEQCDNYIMKHDEAVASSNKLTTSNLNKGLNRSKTVIPKPLYIKTTNKTDISPIKTKSSPLKKKEEKVQVLKLKPSNHSKEENQAKPTTLRPQHRPNWVKSDNRMKLAKSEPVKDKPVIRKTDVPPKIKKPEVIQPATNNTSSVENRVRNGEVCNRQNFEEKVAEKKVSNSNFMRAENFSEVLYEKSNDSGMLQDGIFKSSENILNETIGTDNKVSENSEKYLVMEAKENIVNDPKGTYADICCKAESTIVATTGQSDTLSDVKSIIVVDEPINVFGNPTPQVDTKFAQGRDFDEIERQTENQNSMLNNSIENMNTSLSECEVVDGPKVTKSLVVPAKCAEKETTTTLDSNVLKNTYLVSFEVKDDEAYLKTRSQVVADEIKGDLIDLNIVLQEEKKTRIGRKSETLLENPKCTTDDVNVLLYASKSELQSQNKAILPKLEDKSKENMKIDITSAINQNVLTEPLTKNLCKSENMNSFNSQSALYSIANPQSLKERNISEEKSSKTISNLIMKAKTPEPMKEEHINKECKDPMKSEGIVSELNAKHKKTLNKSRSLELIGQEKKGKVLRHKKVVPEKERNLLSSMPEKRIKVMNKTKELDKSEKYQEIINSVKKIIPSSNSNENILGINPPKIELTGTNVKTSVNMSKNYTKTINELKEIINELPRSDNQQTIGATKYKHHRERENKNNKTSETFLKIAEKENIASRDEDLEIKQTNIKANNKIKQESPKIVKVVVDKIAKIKEDLKPISAGKIKTEASLTADKEKEDGKTQLKPSKSNTSINKILMENNNLSSHNGQKECTEEISRNLSLKTNRTSTLTHQILSNHPDKIAELITLKGGEFPERALKTKSVSNIQSNERKSEGNKEPVRLNIVPKIIKSDEIEAYQNINGLKNTQLKLRDKSIGDNTSNSPKDHSFAKSKDTKRVKSAGIEVRKTSDNEKDSTTSNFRKSTDSKLSFFKVQESRENTKIIKSKSDLNMKKIDTPKIKGPKRINIPPETDKSGGIQRDLSITGTGKPFRKNTNKVTVESREKKSKDQTNAIVTESGTYVSIEMNNNKTNSSDNEQFKFAMDKFVNESKTSIANQGKIIKFARLGETVLKKNTKSENNLIKKEIPPANTTKGKNSSVEIMDKQIIESQKTAHLSPSMLQGKNKNTESKVKKETQPTGILTKKTLKAKIISNEKPEIKVQSSKLSGDVNALPKNIVQSRVQVNSGDTMNKELLNLSKRLEKR